MNVYIDESGDLGFTFDKPFRKGGSSRYLTISFLLTPKELSYLPQRIVRKLYYRRRQPSKVELKGAQLTPSEKAYFSNKAGELVARHPEIKIFAITVNKRTVKNHIRWDCSKLFNYINRSALPDRIKQESNITFIPDKRSVKARNGNSLADYLQAELWFGANSRAIIDNKPQESHKVLNLQFIDWIGHIVWARFEDDEAEAYNILKRKVKITPWWETLSDQW
jgi:hypothetical protein